MKTLQTLFEYAKNSEPEIQSAFVLGGAIVLSMFILGAFLFVSVLIRFGGAS
jgi:hypothetical protein